jgi:hypothetical protein
LRACGIVPGDRFLSFNQLAGTLPAELGSLTKLQFLCVLARARG